MEIPPLKIAPSILSADFGSLNEEIATVEPHADLLHIDVMDGHFVPNISFGAPVMRCIRSGLPMDVHLMIEHPLQYAEDFVKAGGTRIIFHVECKDEATEVIEKIESLEAKVAVSIKPATPVSAIAPYLERMDMVMIMTVEPGFGGQKFMEDMVPKIRELREMGFDRDIGIDGGINDGTAKVCVDAGANLLIAGSYVFKSMDRGAMIDSLR